MQGLTLSSIADRWAVDISSTSFGATWVHLFPFALRPPFGWVGLDRLVMEVCTTSRWALYTSAWRSAPENPRVRPARSVRSTSGPKVSFREIARRIYWSAHSRDSIQQRVAYVLPLVL